MDKVDHIRPKFPANAYAGTAAYYSRYRVPYPKVLMTDLLKDSGVSGAGNLLDLACGPGRVGLPLASSFREVWALDLEPEMIEEGQIQASRLGVRNIRWMQGRAEDLFAAPGTFELITIGEAFHRLDQQIVAVRALGWLKTGSCIATLGCDTILSGKEPWQRIVADVVYNQNGRKAGRADSPRRPGSGPGHYERVLLEAGFVEVRSHRFVAIHEWSIESILGYLYSTSVCAKAILGGVAERFESDLRAALLAHNPSGIYRENTQWGYTIGRKPG
jgi:SAM-dependent methyltransferase